MLRPAVNAQKSVLTVTGMTLSCCTKQYPKTTKYASTDQSPRPVVPLHNLDLVNNFTDPQKLTPHFQDHFNLASYSIRERVNGLTSTLQCIPDTRMTVAFFLFSGAANPPAANSLREFTIVFLFALEKPPPQQNSHLTKRTHLDVSGAPEANW